MFKLWTGFKNYHKTKILVGYPTLNPDGRFLKSLSKFIKQARKKYNIEVLPINTFYELSLGIKYFFDSIIQIFTFISILLYVNVMRIILKQVYDEK